MWKQAVGPSGVGRMVLPLILLLLALATTAHAFSSTAALPLLSAVTGRGNKLCVRMGGGGGNGGGRVIRVVGAVAVQDNQVKIQGEAERDLTDEASQGGRRQSKRRERAIGFISLRVSHECLLFRDAAVETQCPSEVTGWHITGTLNLYQRGVGLHTGRSYHEPSR